MSHKYWLAFFINKKKLSYELNSVVNGCCIIYVEVDVQILDTLFIHFKYEFLVIGLFDKIMKYSCEYNSIDIDVVVYMYQYSNINEVPELNSSNFFV